MTVTFTPVTDHYVYHSAAIANEYRTAMLALLDLCGNPFSLVYGSTPYVAGDATRPASAYWVYGEYSGVYDLCTYRPDPGNPGHNYTLASFFAALGFRADGPRRAVTRPTDWTDRNDPAYLGWGGIAIQNFDLIGRWVFADLQAAFHLLLD